MGLIIKIHLADGTLERVITKGGDVDVTFHKGGGHKPFIRFNKDPATDVDFSGQVSLFTEMGAHLETISEHQLKLMGR
jgi:hypothetical protein